MKNPSAKLPEKLCASAPRAKAAFLHKCPNCSQYCSFAGRFLEASWRRCHSSSGFSLSQFVLFLHVIPDRLMMIRSMCGALAVVRLLVQTNLTGLLQLMAKCTLIFPTDTQLKKIEITNLKPFFSWFERLVF